MQFAKRIFGFFLILMVSSGLSAQVISQTKAAEASDQLCKCLRKYKPKKIQKAFAKCLPNVIPTLDVSLTASSEEENEAFMESFNEELALIVEQAVECYNRKYEGRSNVKINAQVNVNPGTSFLSPNKIEVPTAQPQPTLNTTQPSPQGPLPLDRDSDSICAIRLLPWRETA